MTTINIITDKPLYQKTEDVIVTAIDTVQPIWSKMVVQIWNGKSTIAEKQWSKPDDIDGHVTWIVPHSMFTSSNPQYTAKVLCEGKNDSKTFEHY